MTVVKSDTSFKGVKNTGASTSRAAPVAIVNRAIYQAVALITRPANATQYGANDMIGQADATVAANAGSAILEFVEIGPKGGAVEIVAADLMVYINAVTANMGAFTLHLFDAAPAAKLDNDAFTVADADRTAYLGAVAIGTPVDLGANIYIENVDLKNKVVKLAADSTSLFGVLVGAGTDVPVSGAVYKVRLTTRAAH